MDKQKKAEYDKRRRQEKKEEIVKRENAYREAHREEEKERVKQWKLKNPDKTKQQAVRGNKKAMEKRNTIPEERDAWNARMRVLGKKDRDRMRNKIVNLLGGKCVKCGFSDARALQVDHINGGGSQAHKSSTSQHAYNKTILTSIENNENKYQLLCANCNWIKRHDNREVLGT